jgi:hypothetical protein
MVRPGICVFCQGIFISNKLINKQFESLKGLVLTNRCKKDSGSADSGGGLKNRKNRGHTFNWVMLMDLLFDTHFKKQKACPLTYG